MDGGGAALRLRAPEPGTKVVVRVCVCLSRYWDDETKMMVKSRTPRLGQV